MIELKKVSKSFGEKIIFTDLSYKINNGEFVAIVGKSGCGKSTLLNIIGLLDFDYTGEVLFNGKDVAMLKEKQVNEYIRNNINYLFQNYALIDDESVEYNLLLALEYEKIPLKEKKEKVSEALDKVGLASYNNKKVYTLSGGEQQRVALARIMLKKGDIILADEPTGNLDNSNARKVMSILKQLNKQGKTIIMVTHNEQLAQECDAILHL